MQLTAASLLERLDRLAVSSPDETAYRFLDDQGSDVAALTYGHLRRRALSLAAHLDERAGRGERALLVLPTGPDFLCAFLGCLYAGVLAVPVTPPRRGRSEHLRVIARDCRPAVALGEAGGLELEWVSIAGLEDREFEARKPGPVAYLQYTSGATGNPRAVPVSHAELAANAARMQATFEQPDGATLAGWLPLTNCMGLMGLALQSLFLGGCCVLLEPATFVRQPQRWLEAIARYQAHTSGAPNWAYELCLRKLTTEQPDLRCWQAAVNAGEPVRAATMERFARRFGLAREALFAAYGLAEARGLVSAGRALLPGPAASCGRPAPEHHVSVRSTRDDGVGPIWLGEVPTGDLGVLREGELFVLGRDFVGADLVAEEVEALLEACHPQVRAGGCCAFDHQGGLVVALELRERVPPEELLPAVEEALGRRPFRVLALGAGDLPRTVDGKLRRAVARTFYLAGEWGAGWSYGHRQALQDRIHGLVAAHLGVSPEQLPRQRAFDDLGLDSVERIGLTGFLAQELGRSLAGDITWQYPTVELLAQALQEGMEGRLAYQLRAGRGAGLWLVHGVAGETLWFNRLLHDLPDVGTIWGLRQVDADGNRWRPREVEAMVEQHVRTMTGAAPGPYRILGYSYGCRIAYGIACRLHEMGHRVEFVGLLDGYPEGAFDVPARHIARMLAGFPAWLARRALEGDWPMVRRELQALRHWLWQWVLRRWADRPHPAPPEQDLDEENVRLLFGYRPKPSPLAVTLFRTRERLLSPVHQPDGGWGHLALGGVRIIDLPGGHNTVILPPHSKVAARALAQCLAP